MVDAALISGLLSNLAPLIKDEFSLFWNFRKEVQKLSSTLSAINALLEDAERKAVREKDQQTEGWLRKLKDVLYEVRDIMDECTFEDLRLQVNRRSASSSTRIKVTNFITHPFSNTWTRLKVGHKIKEVQEKLNQISWEHQNLSLPQSIHDSKIDKFTSSWRETMSLPSCNQVYGRDKEKKDIIDILLNNTSSVAKNLSVLPIVGIGGSGKTTLAQMVFNDDEVSKHFDPKIWVCVSDEFEVKLVIKSIIGATTETSLEILQKMIQDKLKGKRYLIVLDDVWNEKVEAWDQLRSILDCGSNGAFVLTTTRKENVAKIMKNKSIIPHFKLSLLSEDDCWLLFEERAFEHGKPKPPNFINIGKEIAKKCKGVPLVAKTLGSQLGFSEDNQDEWCRIRDSEIWEISQNEEFDLLHILRLSYYDLPYHLRRCFVFCVIFLKDTEIEKEKLIQLWMAHGLIPTVKNQEVENIGNTIWKELCWRSFFQDEKENKDLDDGVYTTCMMHDLMHDLAHSVMKDECYTIDANSSSDGLEREIRHVTVMAHELDKTSVCSLKKMRWLQSIMLHGRYVGNEILSILKELPSLRVIEVSRCNVQYQDLCYVERLKHLRYLDISYSNITTLPNSICNLLNLQTLKLNYCSELKSLPRNTRDLINLRHLYLKNCNGLNYMPKGIGKLKHLKTLSLLVIGKKGRDCQLDEIKELDMGGSLTIKNLGRVSDASIARGISMAKKSSINKLELKWRSNYEVDNKQTKTRHEKISEALEVSTARLKILKMSGYKGVNPSKWVRMSSPSPTHFESKEMIALFPLLEELVIDDMKNLRELVSSTIPSLGAFPNLSKIEIYDCPKLGALPRHLKALKQVTVLGECTDELLYSISNLSALTHLYIRHMNERRVLFSSALMFDDEISLSSQILGDNNNESQLEVRSSFQSLQSLSISRCAKLRRLFDEGIIMQDTLKISGGQNQQKHNFLGQTERTRLMSSLTELYTEWCPKLMISLEEFEKLNMNNSLQNLTIRRCPKLVSSEEESHVIALLRSVRARICPVNFSVDIILEMGDCEPSLEEWLY